MSLLSACALLVPAPVAAHPVDEANVYHYLWLEGRPGEISLQQATYAGGLVTPATWSLIDTDRSGDLSEVEQQAYAQSLAAGLKLAVDGRPVRWKLVDSRFPSKETFFAGVFPEAAIALRLTAPLPRDPGAGVAVELHDESLVHFTAVFPRPTLKGFGVATGALTQSDDGRTTRFRVARDGTPLSGGDEPLGSVGSSLGTNADSTDRPGSRLPGLTLSGNAPTEPANGNAPTSSATSPAGTSPLDRSLSNAPLFPEKGTVLYTGPKEPEGELDGVKGMLAKPLTPWLILLGLAAAVLAGMVHALSPGHGKTMVAAYLVGSRGTLWDAVVLGITVTITHTGTVYLLGALTLWLTTRIRAEVVTHWLSIFSGALVAAMGFWLLQRGILAYYGIKPLPGHSHAPDHGNSHGGHNHGHAHGGTHDHRAPDASPAGERVAAPRPPRDNPLDGAPALLPKGDEKDPLGRWGVIGLGVAGGIVPCPDALAILLAAVSLGHIWLGLGIIAAFSFGMALVLVAIGVVMVVAKDRVARFTSEAAWIKVLPMVSGAVVFLLGLWLTVQSLVTAGVLGSR